MIIFSLLGLLVGGYLGLAAYGIIDVSNDPEQNARFQKPVFKVLSIIIVVPCALGLLFGLALLSQ